MQRLLVQFVCQTSSYLTHLLCSPLSDQRLAILSCSIPHTVVWTERIELRNIVAHIAILRLMEGRGQLDCFFQLFVTLNDSFVVALPRAPEDQLEARGVALLDREVLFEDRVQRQWLTVEARTADPAG